MKFAPVATALAALLPSVVADGAAFRQQIETQVTNTDQNINAIRSFTPQNLFALAPIAFWSTKILADFAYGTAVFNASEPLTNEEAETLFEPTQRLVKLRLTASDTIISKRPVYEATGTLPIFQGGARAAIPASGAFNDALVAKLPEDVKPRYLDLISPLAPALQRNLAALS